MKDEQMKISVSSGSDRNPYREWLRIEISHEYFGDRVCPAMLVPEAATAVWLQRQGILVRNRHAGQCLLLARGEIVLADEDVDLQFEIRVADARFHYVSGSCEANRVFAVSDSEVCGVWKKITIDPRLLAAKQSKHLTIRIKACEKYIEYLCIPKYNKTDLNLRMSGSDDSLRLINPPERVALPGIPAAWKFVSKEKVRLSRTGESNAKLWEIRNHGERIIGNAIPFPLPEQYSPLSPKDTITRFFYY